ncbi:hypothetical protein [Nonomuraea sp. NPDC023979]|uniref:hypothetical protein n=1 Tax=Nonomuraea sp. NPDC023979 TaxID=3154796 RepID=UPI0033DF96C3
MAHQKPKPSPHTIARAAFQRVCGIASAPWEAIAPAMAADLKAASYLRDRTVAGAEAAEKTIRTAIWVSGIVPLGGDIDGAHAGDVADLALRALSATDQLTRRAVERLPEEV